MNSPLIRTALILATVSLVGIATAEAGPISPQNPFRSYNLSGINYGSQQWERDRERAQAKQGIPTQQQQGVRLFRRRQR